MDAVGSTGPEVELLLAVASVLAVLAGAVVASIVLLRGHGRPAVRIGVALTVSCSVELGSPARAAPATADPARPRRGPSHAALPGPPRWTASKRAATAEMEPPAPAPEPRGPDAAFPIPWSVPIVERDARTARLT